MTVLSEVMENKGKRKVYNIKSSLKGTKLHLTIDLEDYMNNRDLPLSSSGKTYIIASCSGNMEGVLQDVKIGLNLYTSVKNYSPVEEVQKEVQKVKEDSTMSDKERIDRLEGMLSQVLDAVKK